MNTAILQCVLLIFGCALVKCAVEKNAFTTSDVFTLDDFLNKTFIDKKWTGIWVDDENFMYKKDDYYLFNAKTKKSSLFISGKVFDKYPDAILKVSKNKNYILLKYNIKSVYRHSTTADYGVYNVSDGKLIALDRFQYCELTPKNNAVVAVKDNNIYYFSDIDKASASNVPITKDGIPGVLYNGIPDWAYEEEVISGDSAIWVSPNGETLVYAKFNDTKVENFTYFTYGTPGSINDQYPTSHILKYPKAGTPNPVFSLWTYNFKNTPSLPIKLSFGSQTSDNFVLYDVTWKNNNTILVTYTNRLQHIGFLDSCTVSNGICNLVDKLEENSGWLEISPPQVIDNGSKIIERINVNDFDAFRITISQSETKTVQIGDRIISSIHGVVNSTIFFEASESTKHSQQHIYALNLNTEQLKCLSCNFTVFDELCKFTKADFSLGKTYMTRICLGPGPTYVDIVNLLDETSYHWDGVNNTELRQRLKTKTMPIIKDLTVDIPNTKFTAAVRLLLPPNFNENSSIQYPVLVNVYGGPNSNQIKDSYSIGLEHFLVTSRNYIYVFIDGRGSGKRGKRLMHSVYKKLGQYEIDDQITVTKWLRDTLSYVDGSKIGIWGWSYGGFATAWAMVKDNDTFKCGVSVAPVTNFIYYDSIYTERYMRLPTASDNMLGYNNTDLTRRAESFRNKTFLLIHGNADDNVHYQQAMMLARSLELADVPFQQISYPDENHSLGGVLKHLYHSLDAYWKTNFQSDVKPTTETPMNNGLKGRYREVPVMFLIAFVLLAFSLS